MFEKVIINVGGQIFITKRSTLQRYPGTKLSNVSETCEHFDETTEVYYFDRNPLIFQSVLDYYRTGKLHFLSNICAEQIRDELEFWEISTTDLGPCCWKYFYTVDSDLKTCNVIDKYFFQNKCFLYSSKSPLINIKNRILNVLENPRSSKVALVWQIFYLSVVCLAILVSVIQSFELTGIKTKEHKNVTAEESMTERLTDHDNWIGVVTHICNVIFTLETALPIIFGITIHIVEMNGPFTDPISSFYWALITMTTIGYGDIYPITKYGQILASVCATFGLFLLSMPIAVVANTFTDLYKDIVNINVIYYTKVNESGVRMELRN
ncbi:KCNC1 [Mytilus edulis]|uniref:KCNC1 n=1 Tax=Mytilus edulis TaxID=6550 RepID=A0A8S3VDU5_MYTED|nr:KCNC1 [Mytilus edulis]